jgi:hypothetical protein
MKCPVCKNTYSKSGIDDHFKSSHKAQYKTAKKNWEDDNDGDFLLSAAIGYATNSSVLGGLLGGDFVGGMIGDALNSDDDSSSSSNDSSSDSGSDSGGGSSD